MNSKKSKVFIGGLIALAVGIGAIYLNNKAKLNMPSEQIACTMDAKMCPDGSYVGRTGPKCEFQKCPEPVTSLDYKDGVYVIDGYLVKLLSGISQIEAAPGSAMKVVTKYFGNVAEGDFDGDGDVDIAFLLTQNSGGSGTFYYVVAALKNDSGYQGTNAVLLGDRIAPQTTEFRAGEIIVNFTERKEGEPMTVKPSMAVSKYFMISGGMLIVSK